MDKETKIVLAVRDEEALYLFKREFGDFTTVEFVVGCVIGNPAIGDFVDGWSNGQYFRTLEEAFNYLKRN